MVENLQIYKDASELIKRVFIIVKQFPRDYKYCYNLRKSIAKRNNLVMYNYEKLIQFSASLLY